MLTVRLVRRKACRKRRDPTDSQLVPEKDENLADEQFIAYDIDEELKSGSLELGDSELENDSEEIENWEYYDENEGQELEQALDDAFDTFTREFEEYGSMDDLKESAEYLGEIKDSEFREKQRVKFSAIKGDSAQSTPKILEDGEFEEMEGVSDTGWRKSTDLLSISSKDRQEGLLNVHDAARDQAELSEMSEQTWPPSPSSEVDDIMRQYLPELYEHEAQEDLDMMTSETESPIVLESENPMMEKFQKLLRDHLLRQVARITDQIQQVVADTKRLEDESKQRASCLYREEKFVRKQREDIDEYRANLTQIQSRREVFEKELEGVRETHKKARQEYNDAKHTDDQLIKEKEILNDLLHKLRAFEAEKDMHLKTSHAMSQHLQGEKRRLAEEKMKQDILMWKLEKEIIRLNNEIEQSNINCKDMRNEVECMNDLLVKMEKDSVGIMNDNKLLHSSLMAAYGSIKECDNRKHGQQVVLEACVNNYYLTAKNKTYWQNTLKKNYSILQDLETQKGELLTNLDYLRNKLTHMERLIQQLEREAEMKNATLKLTEEEKDKLEKEGAGLEKFKANLDFEVAQKTAEFEKLKRLLSDLSVEKQVTQKGITHYQNEIRKLGELNRQTEEKIVDSELELGKALLDMERARGDVLKAKDGIQKALKTTRELEQEMRELSTVQKRLKGKLNFINSQLATLENRLETKNKDNLSKAKNDATVSWAETKLKRLQDALKLATELNKKQTDGWFNLQNIIMARRDQRAKQIHRLNIKRKHCHTLDSCRLRVERNLSSVLHTISQYNKNITKEQRQFERWQMEKLKIANKLDRLTHTNAQLETKFIDDVADAEKEARQIESEIEAYKIEIEANSKDVAALQAEFLEAEKKRDLAEIAKLKIDQFQAPSGEIGQLKLEIHRMEVRYSHLRKAQEKLMNDMEQCISRRDRMIDNAEAREVRSQITGKQWSRIQVQQKMDELKNKIQSLKRKNAILNKEQVELSYQLAEAREEHINIKSGIETLKNSFAQLERQMEEGQLHKHACLEMTVYRQKKAKLLEDFKFGRYKGSYFGALAAEEEKQRCLMFSLRDVLENLLNDFPQLNLQLAQIMNTLQPVVPAPRECEEK
ncbi:coiled-coil domain containing 40 [Nesidiocoris tenuis]|uniref:Coiled-coil domain containing 40 n=1 Tax=Nesidiocoris tenuis TaxID=355587 RepID=A0ABN7BEF7_9HEMI|nr:coiled-coil domain containing 40 [Nesidiocoris tenuis]